MSYKKNVYINGLQGLSHENRPWPRFLTLGKALLLSQEWELNIIDKKTVEKKAPYLIASFRPMVDP